MVLVKKSLLSVIHKKWSQGVPALLLIRLYELEGKITPPTLTKLLKFMSVMSETKDNEVKAVIAESLFPKWLSAEARNSKESICKQPKTMVYRGRMPLGYWSVRVPEATPREPPLGRREITELEKTKNCRITTKHVPYASK